MEERLISQNPHNNEHDTSLRPKSLQDFIGQEQLKANLSIYIKAAKNRKEPLDHVLLYGPPGLGKTTIAQITANEMGSNIKIASGPTISKAGDLAAILTNLTDGDILFIDEIHRMHIAIEEVLYPAMEDFTIDLMIGEGPSARSLRIDLPRFTLIGATTRTGLLSNPLRDRFGIPLRLNFYTTKELTTIIKRSAHILNVTITESAAEEIGQRARGTPRIALRLIKRIRDFAEVVDRSNIDQELAKKALTMLEVDNSGLDNNDHRYLKMLIDNFNGGPVGIETIAAALAEQRDTIEDTIEPYLIQEGFIQRTPRGRMVTVKSYQHFGYTPPSSHSGFSNGTLRFVEDED